MTHHTRSRWRSLVPLAREDDRRLALVDRAPGFAIAAFLGDANRPLIAGPNQAHRPRRPEARLAPGDGGAHGLRRIALAVHAGGECPAEFRHPPERRRPVALEIREPPLPDHHT